MQSVAVAKLLQVASSAVDSKLALSVSASSCTGQTVAWWLRQAAAALESDAVREQPLDVTQCLVQDTSLAKRDLPASNADAKAVESDSVSAAAATPRAPSKAKPKREVKKPAHAVGQVEDTAKQAGIVLDAAIAAATAAGELPADVSWPKAQVNRYPQRVYQQVLCSCVG